MGIELLVAVFAALALTGVVGTVRAVRKDGYGRRPDRPVDDWRDRSDPDG